MKTMVYDWDLQLGTIMRFGKSIESLSGFKLETFSKEEKYWDKRIHPEDAKMLYSQLIELIDAPTEHLYEYHYRYLQKNGEYHLIKDSGYIIRDKKGKATRLTGSLSEIPMSDNPLNPNSDRAAKYFKVGFWELNLNTKNLHWSDEMYKIWHQCPNSYEPAWDKYLNSIHPADCCPFEKDPQNFSKGFEPYTHQFRIILPDKKVKWIAESRRIIYDDKGKPFKLEGIVKDISQRIEKEQQLKLYESVVTHTKDAVMITEAEPKGEPGPRILYVNDAFCKMTGYKKEEVIGKTPRILQGPKSDFKALKRLRKALDNWQPCEIETINYKKNGEEFWINFHVVPVADESGWYTHWIAIERDVTEQKNQEAERKLFAKMCDAINAPAPTGQCLSEMLRLLLEHTGLDMAEAWLTNIDNRKLKLMARQWTDENLEYFAEFSSAFQHVKIDEGLPGKTWKAEEILYWEGLGERPEFIRSKDARFTGIQTAIGVPLKYNDSLTGVFVFFSKKALIDINKFTSLFSAFSVHLGPEIQRRKSEEELNAFFNISRDLLCIVGFDGYFKKLNPSFASILGYTIEELMSKPLLDFVHPEDREESTKELKKNLKGGKAMAFENRYITKSGDVVWLSWSSMPDEHEELIYAVARDVTETRKSELQLREANIRYELAARTTSVGVWDFNLKDNTFNLDKSVYHILGIDENCKDVLAAWKKCIHTEDYIKGYEMYEKALQSDNAVDGAYRIVKPGEAVCYINTTAQVIRDENNAPVRIIGLIWDNTKDVERKLEIKKALKEKTEILESIRDGFFAVNHDWTITYWNYSMVDIFTLPRQAVLNKKLWEKFPKLKGTNFETVLKAALASQEDHSLEFYFPPLEKWLEAAIYPTPNGLSVYIKNITKDKEQELEILNLKNSREVLINSTEDVIWSIDDQMRLTYANKSFLEFSKYLYKSGLQIGDCVLNDELDKNRYREWQGYYQKALNGHQFNIILTDDIFGVTRYTSISFNPIFDEISGKCTGTAGFTRDITERIQQLKAIEEQNKSLKEIAWMQSHETRAPLANIIGLINILLNHNDGNIDTETLLQDIAGSAEELDRIIRKIVNLTTKIPSCLEGNHISETKTLYNEN